MTTNITSITAVRLTGAASRDRLPLLVVGPSLGTSALALWSDCAEHLTDRFDVLAWDLPGHGYNTGVPAEPFTVADLAAALLGVVDEVMVQRGTPHDAFAIAGNSAGGVVALQVLLDAPERVASAVLLCTPAGPGDTAAWDERIAQVRNGGTDALVEAATERWFGPGFVEREPARTASLQRALRSVSAAGYVGVCEALASYDVRDRLGEIAAPVLVVAGEHDRAVTPAAAQQVADGVQDGRTVVLDGVAHLPPAEVPAEVATLIRHHVLGEPDSTTDPEHTEQTEQAAHALVADHAAGRIGDRPGLDRRSRSLVALATLVGRSDDELFADQVRSARSQGLTGPEIEEALLQTAVHVGVADAATAVRIARAAFEEERP
ncbi:alpha/beta fold hydrolase [Nocardioides sp.]|uniref:alpha/beta fold hydrolase n=1 Tax=Nocardioides sp. TaxID=35761 RepID=UPI002B26803B|nr:alpha/beta fold hydrolase [Nocardioides sp.]